MNAKALSSLNPPTQSRLSVQQIPALQLKCQSGKSYPRLVSSLLLYGKNKHCYLNRTWSDKAFNDTVVNRALASLHGGSLKFTLTVYSILRGRTYLLILTFQVLWLWNNSLRKINDCLKSRRRKAGSHFRFFNDTKIILFTEHRLTLECLISHSKSCLS